MPFHKGHKLNLGNQFAKGNKHTPEWKQVASNRLIGNKQGFKKGQPSPRKGRRLPQDKTVWNKGKKLPNLSGENHWNWVADRSLLKKQNRRNDSSYKEWRKRVWERDGYKCQILNKDCNGRIEAHHILRWSDHPNLRYETNNGITLCRFHHPKKRKEEEIFIPQFQRLISLTVSHLN